MCVCLFHKIDYIVKNNIHENVIPISYLKLSEWQQL